MTKLSFLEITKRIVKEENLDANMTSVPSINTANNRKFNKYMSQLGIDLNVFKEGGNYCFEADSIPFIKKMVGMKSTEFKSMLRTNPNRDLLMLDNFVDELHDFFDRELKHQPDDLIKAKSFSEIVLARDSEKLFDATRYFFEPIGEEGLPHSDIAELSAFYFKELRETKEKYEAIRSIFADIRNAEIFDISQEEIENGEDTATDLSIPVLWEDFDVIDSEKFESPTTVLKEALAEYERRHLPHNQNEDFHLPEIDDAFIAKLNEGRVKKAK